MDDVHKSNFQIQILIVESLQTKYLIKLFQILQGFLTEKGYYDNSTKIPAANKYIRLCSSQILHDTNKKLTAIMANIITYTYTNNIYKSGAHKEKRITIS